MKRFPVAVLLLALHALTAPAREPVRVAEQARSFAVTDEGGGNPRELTLQQIVMENDYLRVELLPQLGGRIRSVFNKASGRELFLVRPIEWPPTRYTAYGSQLGGHEVNFPSFHHGNNYMDTWNWHVDRTADGHAAVTVGWTDPLRRQRVVVRWSLAPASAVLRARYRFFNLNPQPLGFAPWSNMFFGYADDLQYIIPTATVAPHGFNDSTVELWPWPWPEWDESSLCFWRNIPRRYNSIFAVGVEADFHGVYYTEADHGMVRLFDRRVQPGIKMFCHPPRPDRTPSSTDYTEVWTSPVLSHEDMLWWEAFGTREYEEAFFGVHGIGGYRFANDYGAINLTRHDGAVEIGVAVTRELPGAVVAVAGIDGDWIRETVALSPSQPWRRHVNRAPEREPLDVRVFDISGRCVMHYAQRPDPGMRPNPVFAGDPLWQSSPYRTALKAEQYHVLWRGPTGGYGNFGMPGIRAFRSLLEQDPDDRRYLAGLVRSLLTDVQLRQAGQPRVGDIDATTALAARHLDEAAGILEPHVGDNPEMAVLMGEVQWRKGDHDAARRFLAKAPGHPVASVGLATLAAAGGDADTALRHARQARELLPGNPAVVRLHAHSLFTAGLRADALAELEALVALDPVDPVTARMLAGMADGTESAALWTAFSQRLQVQTNLFPEVLPAPAWPGWVERYDGTGALRVQIQAKD